MKIKECEENVWAIRTPLRLIGAWEIPYMTDVERIWIRNMDVLRMETDHKGRMIVHAAPTYRRK